MNDYTYSPTNNSARPVRPWRWLGYGVLLILLIWLGGRIIPEFGNATITVVNHLTGSHLGNDAVASASAGPSIAQDPDYQMPNGDNSRLDVLVLGMRGKDDVQDGGTLTDTIPLLSIDQKTGKAVLTSIPRDLAIRVTDTKTEKINTAYIYNGLDGTKKLYSRILGVRIDNIVVFDFNAFKYIVDTLGGVTITLDKPFSESQQWSGDKGYTFSLPAGVNNLSGDQALYYARSRYSSSDFDRSRRQMQIIMAIKQKATALNITGDPLKALGLILTIRQHIDTDLNIFDIGTLRTLITEGNQLANIKQYQLTTENLLYETTSPTLGYILLPRDNNLSHIKQFFQSVLTSSPVLPTPIPADASPRATSL